MTNYKGEPRWVEELREFDERIERNEQMKPKPDLAWWALAIIIGLCIGGVLIHFNPLGL